MAGGRDPTETSLTVRGAAAPGTTPSPARAKSGSQRNMANAP